MIKDDLELLLYNHFPFDITDFRKNVKSNCTMDELRKSCYDEINALIKRKCTEARNEVIRETEKGEKWKRK